MPRSQVTELLMLIYDRGPLSRTEVVKIMDLSPSYVSTVVRQLEGLKLLLVSGRSRSGGGRRRVLLDINPDLGHFIGIDISSLRVRFVVTDLLGGVIARDSCPTDACEGHLLREIESRIEALLEKNSGVRGIGVGEAGLIDPDTGIVSFPRLKGWRAVPLQKFLHERFGLPVIVDDSARAAAMAERRFGQGKGVQDAFFVLVRLGIGAAVFVGGRIHRGHSGLAGEIGHMTIAPDGELCYCGNRGCLEMYASGNAILQNIRSALIQGVNSVLSPLDPEQLSYEAIVNAAETGDRLAYGTLTQAGMHLGTALAGIVNLLNPSKIILGGRLPRVAGRWLNEPLMRSLRERAFPQSLRALDVTVSSLGDEAVACGATLMIGRSFLKRRVSDIRPQTAANRPAQRFRQ